MPGKALAVGLTRLCSGHRSAHLTTLCLKARECTLRERGTEEAARAAPIRAALEPAIARGVACRGVGSSCLALGIQAD